MKCPKCGYISFDYNQVCPKCNKDISAEQDKLHIPAFRPDPPALLGALIGESNETHIGMHGDSSGEMTYSSGEQLQFDDSAAMERGDIEFGDSQELSVGTEPEMPTSSEGLGDFEISSEQGLSDFELEEELGGSLADEQAGPEDVERPLSDSSTLDLGEDISMDFEGLPGQKPAPKAPAESTLEEDLGIDLDALRLEGRGTEKRQGAGEIELELDDLDSDGIADLDLTEESPSGEDLADTLDVEDLSLDEIQLEESEPDGLKDEDLLSAEEGSDEDDISIDLEDLDLELDLDDSKSK